MPSIIKNKKLKFVLQSILLILLLIALFIFGFGYHLPAAKNPRARLKLPAKLAHQFSDYQPLVIKKHKATKLNTDFDIKSFKIPIAPVSSSKMLYQTAYFDLYISKSSLPKPLIFVLPILGGGYVVSSAFARTYATNDYDVLLLNRLRSMDKCDDVEDVESHFRREVKLVRAVLDWVMQQPQLNHQRIGLLGISMGAIKASLLAAVEERFKAICLVLPGSNLAYSIAHANENSVMRMRKSLMNANKWNSTQLQQYFTEQFSLEPLDFAKYVDPTKLMIFLARFDQVLLYKNGLNLWQELGRPELYCLPAGHYSGVVFLPLIKSQSTRFFDQKLKD